MPTQVVLLVGFPAPELHAARVVVNETTGTIQEGMTMPADTILIAQKNPGINGCRIHGIQGSDPQFSTFKAGTTTKDILDFLVR